MRLRDACKVNFMGAFHSAPQHMPNKNSNLITIIFKDTGWKKNTAALASTGLLQL